MRGWIIVALAACELSGSKDAGSAHAAMRAIDAAAPDAMPARDRRIANLPTPESGGCPATCAPLAQRVHMHDNLCGGEIGSASVLADEATDGGCGDHLLYVGCCDPINADNQVPLALWRLGWTHASHDQRVALAYAYVEVVERQNPIEPDEFYAKSIGKEYTPPTDTPNGDGVQIDFWETYFSVWEAMPPSGKEQVIHVRYRFDATGAETFDKLTSEYVDEPPLAEQYVMKRDAGP